MFLKYNCYESLSSRILKKYHQPYQWIEETLIIKLEYLVLLKETVKKICKAQILLWKYLFHLTQTFN